MINLEGERSVRIALTLRVFGSVESQSRLEYTFIERKLSCKRV